MNDTTNNEQRIEDEEATSNSANRIGAEVTSQRSTGSNNINNNNNIPSQATVSSTTASNDLVADEEEEHIVTSTSSENSGNTPRRPSNTNLQSLVTSPARITSSTGNDYSSSPTQAAHNREESAHILLSSEDDSLEHQQVLAGTAATASSVLKAGETRALLLAAASAMPTTSAAAAATLRTIADPQRGERTKDTVATSLCNNLQIESDRETRDLPTAPSINSSSNSNKNINSGISQNRNPNLNSSTDNKMVARGSMSNNLSGVASLPSTNAQTENQVEKIILKLPKPATNPTSTPPPPSLPNESHHKQQQQTPMESLDKVDPAIKSSKSIVAEPDTRRVEPLKINLHHGGHHHHHHHSPSATASTSNVIPKITIKPLIKKTEPNEESHEKSATATVAIANQEAPIPKLTIKASSLSGGSTMTTTTSGSDCAATTEPHIVPKLTIRAAHEDGGGTLTTVVPKLTIKLPDQQTTHNSAHSPATINRTNFLETPPQLQQQPPLPKLTIKTTLDGSSGSSIMCSSISPALSSSNSSSSAASSPQNAASTTSTSSNSCSASASSAVGVVPKLSIKTSTATSLTSSASKSHEDHPALPKLTIKTSATGSCVSTATKSVTTDVASSNDTEANNPVAASSSCAVSPTKLPKMTIKTGQEHAHVIITQHNNDQTIPKLTIKTKSLEIEPEAPSCEFSAEPPPEKIPKFTIKTASLEANSSSAIPKLTISTPNSPKSLVVRQVAVAAGQPTALRKTQSPDRVPKLMISRQDSSNISNCTVTTETIGDKIVPKLTIKTAINDYRTHEETTTTTGDKSTGKIAKFTIKNLQTTVNSAQQQSSEDSDDTFSIESPASPAAALKEEKQQQQPTKVVPKLTIKNLGSPKLKLKSVMEEIPAMQNDKCQNTTSSKLRELTSTQTGRKKDVQTDESEALGDGKSAAVVVALVNGGESSSSQEFCGFTDNTTTSTPTPTILNETVTAKTENSTTMTAAAFPCAEEPRRNSDDMDIDEDMHQHDPKMFNNLTHFGSITRNGESYGIHLDNSIDALPAEKFMQSASSSSLGTLENFKKSEHEKSTGLQPSAEVVDTVDLTSSPSPSSSPAHFNYTDADPKIPELSQFAGHTGFTPSNALLMECLQRETSVIQTTPSVAVIGPKANSNSLLLSQLTAPLRHPPPPPLLPRPPPHLLGTSQSSLRYPQLTERLLANGAHLSTQSSNTQQTGRNLTNKMFATATEPNAATVIDSIEILDTPEGSPRSSQGDVQAVSDLENIYAAVTQKVYGPQATDSNASDELLRHNNNVVPTTAASENLNNHHQGNFGLKRQNKDSTSMKNSIEIVPQKVRRTDAATTMATLTIFTNDNTDSERVITTSPTLISNSSEINCNTPPKSTSVTVSPTRSVPATCTPQQHRSRKQKHENLLSLPIDELESVALKDVNATNRTIISTASAAVATPVIPMPKKRGRPRKNPIQQVATPTAKPSVHDDLQNTPTNAVASSAAERRVQLLRKRLAIDMVAAEKPTAVLEDLLENRRDVVYAEQEDANATETPRRERNVRSTRRCATPNATNEKTTSVTAAATLSAQTTTAKQQRKQRSASGSTNTFDTSNSAATLNHFGGSNSSISSACSSSSSYATTITTTATASAANNSKYVASSNFSISTQIDLATSYSSAIRSSDVNNASTTTTVRMNQSDVQQRRNVATMLPPTKALSSTDPLPDVVFRSQDFSAMMTQQLQTSPSSSRLSSRENSQDGTEFNGSIGSGSGDDSASNFTSPQRTPGPGRGRGRGRGRGSRGGGSAHKAHRLGRGASLVAKQIAMNRPRHVGVLKHTPQPERLKGLFSPSPQVFEEDTRMSADMSQILNISEPQTPIRQPDFFTNEEESQSSIISNTSCSILDPNTIAAVQGGASIKRTSKKKKMEVCAADETEYLVSSIAEYDWPPPKGCCPSKNRDTFMIQEQVANYLGIKSFKRKYPDLPRRQVDMEERNWLQEKGLVSEKMCDLGITAVWASDILDIMYADFYDKYEEYKDYMRQKHLREIEVKQKALGLNVTGRGLQARDRAMLSASKWNAYFNRTRKEERTTCLDLQSLTVNVPLPATVPATTLVNRSIANDIATAAIAEQIDEPPTLTKKHEPYRPFDVASYYPVAIVPGQYGELHRKFSAQEMRTFPLNTALEPFGKKVECAAATTTTDDTDSANETLTAEPNQSKLKRSKVLRSRRARTERKSKNICDINTEQKIGEVSKIDKDDVSGSENCSLASSASSSTSSGSSSSSSCSSSSSTDYSSCSYSSDEHENEIVGNKKYTCSVCQRPQNRNLKDLPELFINCYTCRRRVHPSCIEMPHRMAQRVRNYNWQCAECKCCIKCKRIRDSNKMLYCEQCDRGFHIYCLGIKTIPDGRWSCERCSICMRCGAKKPEGLPQQQQQQVFSPNGEKIKQVKHKKVKWINEYRIDHITKLREHCSMLCVPCGRNRTTTKQQQRNMQSQGNPNNNNRGSGMLSPAGNPNATSQQNGTATKKSEMSPPAAVTTVKAASSAASFTNHMNATASAVASTTSTLATSSTPTSTTTTTSTTTPPPPPVVA